MRERLIELLCTDVECTKDGHGDCSMCEYEYADDKCARFYSELIVDYLLANGVIVPPCKVGDVVYKLFPPYCYKREEDKCDHYCDGYDTTCEEYEGVYEIYSVPFKLGMLDDFGKTVFLTREAAEEALRRGKRG